MDAPEKTDFTTAPCACSLQSPSFPVLLREIPDPPQQLYLQGSLPPADNKWLTVVGSRACTRYGEQVLNCLIESLRGYPVVIVSGLAYGIDALAHRAALRVGIPTVAVPGSGLNWDVLYPHAHRPLAREILHAGGALISEFKPEQESALWTFPRRNRIMAGISHATLLIEAKEKSGSLITAKLTTEYNRDLLVVPGSIFSDTSAGCHQFLKLGATPITTTSDLLQALRFAGVAEANGLASTPKVNSGAQQNPLSSRCDISPTEQRVLDLIAEPMSRAQLIDRLGIPIIEANILLSTMEIKGLITEELGVIRTV